MKSLPSWAERLLRAICPEDLYEQIEGDLMELYNQDKKNIGRRKANLKLAITAIRFFRPGILLRNKFSFTLTPVPMLKNYWKTSYRHLLKSKLNFAFKIGGLTIALVSFLVITLYVSYQLSFDRYHSDYENIYRVNAAWKENGELARYAIVPPGIGPALKETFPEIKSFFRLQATGMPRVKYKEASFKIYGFTIADSSIFNVLSFKFIAGDKHSLDHPGSIVLTQSVAKQIFGEEDPLNKSISFPERDNESFEVTAVIEDVPANSHLDIKALLPFNSLTDSAERAIDPWEVGIDGSTGLYVRLDSHTKPEQLISKAIPFIRSKLTKGEDGLENDYAIWLQPLKDIYLDPGLYAEYCSKGNPVYVYIFSLMGVFLLVISSINYINLSIADFHKRNREIGIRKIMGARRTQIAWQVVTEACSVSCLALVISLGLLYLLFPRVQQSLDGNLSFAMLMEPRVMIMIGTIIFLLVSFSTAYPAYRLAMNNPVNDLKSGFGIGKNTSVAKTLLLTQFLISIICICATLVVGQQLEFIQTRNPGYDRSNLIVVYMPDRYPTEKIQVIKDEFSNLTGVAAVSYSAFRIAGSEYYRDWYRVEIDGEMKQMMLNEVFFDHDFFRATGIPLVAGRSFDPQRSTDAHEAFIVNESAVREFGWADPIGKRISYGFEETEGEKWEGTVIGVVKDFNTYSLHRKIEPLVMRLPWSDWPGNCIHLKINGPLDNTIARIKNKYEEILPGFLMNYSIIEDIYNHQYRNERKAFTTLQLCTWVMVIISSLGMFALSLYMSASRMKEFGIRKVLGATVHQIAILHVGHFIRIVLTANVIALPVVYWLMKTWLNEFAYKVDISGTSFLFVTILSLVSVLVTAGYSSWKSGRMNPIEVIKTE